MAELADAQDLGSCVLWTYGFEPHRLHLSSQYADLAQLAERIISNDEVNSSNLLVGINNAEVVQW